MRISDTVKRLFPSDFEELRPVRKHWWNKINFSKLENKYLFLGLAAAVICIGGSIYYFNKFVNLSRFTEMEQHQIEVQQQRKRNLAVNLARMVIAYAEHERTMYEYMADKRAENVGKTEELIETLKKGGLLDLAKTTNGGGNMEDALSKFLAVAEAYPDLKLSQNFQKLMDALIVSEDRIAASRMEYNKAASVFHAAVRTFPGCVYAWLFGYKERMFHYAQVDEDVTKGNIIPYRVTGNPDSVDYLKPKRDDTVLSAQSIDEAALNNAKVAITQTK
ncbi:MAG: LemA family protein [Candidatus Omnitrophica bacterium]|nr:LemA family protein [Candidatus Omnitrophota bacterium]